MDPGLVLYRLKNIASISFNFKKGEGLFKGQVFFFSHWVGLGFVKSILHIVFACEKACAVIGTQEGLADEL